MNATRSKGSRTGPPRRDFFKALAYYAMAGTGALAVGGVIRFLDFEATPPRQTEFDLGPAVNYAIGSTTVAAQVPAVVIHNAGGFVALSLVCSHLGCTVDTAAQRQLERLRVETDSSGHLIVHTA
jgi:cytochrome b6-f complex iron-sulfur subunit